MLTLAGNRRLTRDVQLRSTRSGKTVATISVAGNRRDRDAEPIYVDLIVWEAPGRGRHTHPTKGQAITLAGRFHPREHATRAGERRIALEVHELAIEYGPKPRGTVPQTGVDFASTDWEDGHRSNREEEEAMAETPRWRLSGDWFDVCRCRVPCGCTFAQAPDEDRCEGILAWHVREGNYGDVSLDGLSVVMVGAFEGNIWTGDAKNSVAGFFLDERADERQREALQTIFSGQAGGWPATFATLVETEFRGIELAPIDFELADDLASWRVEVPGKATGRAEALTGPTAQAGARVQVHNPPGAEVGPGQIATWGTATEDKVEAFGLKWSWPGRSSKHFPFDWSGPDDT